MGEVEAEVTGIWKYLVVALSSDIMVDMVDMDIMDDLGNRSLEMQSIEELDMFVGYSAAAGAVQAPSLYHRSSRCESSAQQI